MSVLASKTIIGVGRHAAGDFTTEPSSYVHLLPEAHTFTSPDTIKLRRTPQHAQNAGLPALRGPLDMAKGYSLDVILKGLSGNNGGAIDPSTTTDCTDLLDCLFGTDSIDPAGTSTTATGGTGASKLLAVTEMARFPIGTAIRFTTTAGTFYRQVRAREGASGAGNLTLDRTFTGAVTNGQTVGRAVRWKDDPAVYEHPHLGFFVETIGSDRRLFLGGMGKWALDFSRGRHAMLRVVDLHFTDVQREDEEGTSYIAPTAGSGLVRVNNKLWVGDDAYIVTDVSVVGGGNIVARGIDDSPHGTFGYTAQKGGDSPRTTLKFKVLLGPSSGALTGELLDSSGTLSVNKAQAWNKSVGDELATWDIAFQVGGALAASGYGVMRAGVMMRAEPITMDGKKWLDVDIEATGFDSDLAPFEWHLF